MEFAKRLVVVFSILHTTLAGNLFYLITQSKIPAKYDAINTLFLLPLMQHAEHIKQAYLESG
jgi:hypothetical protein